MEQEQDYKPNFPEIHKNLYELYLQALTPKRSKKNTVADLNKAHVYFVALVNIAEGGCISPRDSRLIADDIMNVKSVVLQKIGNNRLKWTSEQGAFTFAASNLLSTFRKE